MKQKVEEIVRREWPAIEEQIAPRTPLHLNEPPKMSDYWESRTSPGIPVEWPPVSGSNAAQLDYFVSAAGRNPSKLMDGEWYTGVWGRVRFDAVRKSYAFTLVDGAPKIKCTQGVRPLTPAESKTMQDSKLEADLVSALLSGHPIPAALDGRVHAYYRLWSSCHGVAREVRLLCPAFFQWL
jgi:hypothetical protein